MRLPPTNKHGELLTSVLMRKEKGRDRLKHIYDWVKTGKINLTELEYLLIWVNHDSPEEAKK